MTGMETNFSLHRIKLLLQADWIEHKKSLLYTMGVLFLVWMAILYLSYFIIGKEKPGQILFFFVGGFSTLISFCILAGHKIHRPKGLYYTLPAGNEEKFAALLLEGLVYCLSFLLVYWGGLGLWKLCIPDLSVITTSGMNLETMNMIVFLATLVFLSYVTFRKNPFLTLVGGYTLYCCLFMIALYLLLRILPTTQTSFDVWGTTNLVMQYVILVSTFILMYVAYLKLTEKEKR
jgi:hypothetical protein